MSGVCVGISRAIGNLVPATFEQEEHTHIHCKLCDGNYSRPRTRAFTTDAARTPSCASTPFACPLHQLLRYHLRGNSMTNTARCSGWRPRRDLMTPNQVTNNSCVTVVHKHTSSGMAIWEVSLPDLYTATRSPWCGDLYATFRSSFVSWKHMASTEECIWVCCWV